MSQWTVERAQAWYAAQPWLVGCNFIPSSAINQIEMWQAESFDLAVIERELGWAADIGFNTVRVYLHDLVWRADASGFKTRIDRFLTAASQHGIRPLFVLFDDCWYDAAHLGKQPEPVPGLHNSGWVQSPGTRVVADSAQWGCLKDYVQDILGAFKDDPRVLMWDLYNEVGNNYLPSLSARGMLKWPRLIGLWLRRRALPNHSLRLLKQTFAWAWEVRPSQPLTSSIWREDERALNTYLPEACDIITFHNYHDQAHLEAQIADLSRFGRPLICTEYLARTRGSLIETHLPVFKRTRVGCYNWGLVSGKTQTIYSWRDPAHGSEPAVWFHDLLHPDGRPYRQAEIDLIRQLTAAEAS